MNIDDAIDDYNSFFGTDLGVQLFAGSDSEFIRLAKKSIKSGDRIPRATLDKFFSWLPSGASS